MTSLSQNASASSDPRKQTLRNEIRHLAIPHGGPWYKARTPYDSDGPQHDDVDFDVAGHHFRVSQTGETGINSGRRRYRVECLECRAFSKATTGPTANIRAHLRETHDFRGELQHLPYSVAKSNAHVVERSTVDTDKFSFAKSISLGPCDIPGCINLGFCALGERSLCGEHFARMKGTADEYREAFEITSSLSLGSVQSMIFLLRTRVSQLEDQVRDLGAAVNALGRNQGMVSRARGVLKRISIAIENRRESKAIDDGLDDIIGKARDHWKW